MKTISIKGKAYVEVNERVKFFLENFKDWSIETELLSNNDGIAIIKAIIKDEKGVVRATGHAYEKDGSTFINQTSYIENCETSAVGRALGFLGIGIDASIASADEVVNAMNNQNYEKKPAKNGLDFTAIKEECSKMSKSELNKKYFAVKTYDRYTDKQKDAICKIIQDAIDNLDEE